MTTPLPDTASAPTAPPQTAPPPPAIVGPETSAPASEKDPGVTHVKISLAAGPATEQPKPDSDEPAVVVPIVERATSSLSVKLDVSLGSMDRRGISPAAAASADNEPSPPQATAAPPAATGSPAPNLPQAGSSLSVRRKPPALALLAQAAIKAKGSSPGLPGSARGMGTTPRTPGSGRPRAASDAGTPGGKAPLGKHKRTGSQGSKQFGEPNSDRPTGAKLLQQLTQQRVQPAVRMKQLNMRKVNVTGVNNRTGVLASALSSVLGGEETTTLKKKKSRKSVGTSSGVDSTLDLIKAAAGIPVDGPEEEPEQIRETVDPFMRNRPKLRIDKRIWLALPFVIGATLVMLMTCFGVDKATSGWSLKGRVPANYDYSFSAFIYTLLNPNPDQSRAVMQAVTNTMAFVFGLLITIIGLILQFASDKITSHVTSLFFKDPIILGALTFVLVSNAFALWVYLECGIFHSPRFSVVLCVVMVDAQLVMLFPFLAYLFFFLDAEEVVTNIMTNGLNAVISSINARGPNNEKDQVSATLSIEYLMDGALSSIKKKNKNITSEILDALCSFMMHYSAIKSQAPKQWFTIPLWIRQSPDFLILNDEGVEELVERELWMEWKVLRQYQNLFVEAIKFFKEMCYHICINTRIIGETAANFGQYHTIDLCIKFFNTYLRTAINLTDVRVVYNTLFQYRLFAELLIDKDRGSTKDLALRALKIAKFVRYYAFICQQRNLAFLVETVAQDLRILCQAAIKSAIGHSEAGKKGKKEWNPTRAVFEQVHDKLLTIMLSINDFTGTTDAKRGVIRAEVILAVFYIAEGQPKQAMKICKQLDREDFRDTLLSVKEEMSLSTTKEFWEVSERGANFTYLEPRLRANLPNFFKMFSWFESLSSGEYWRNFQKSKEGKQLHVQQELQNFETEVHNEEEEEEEEEEEDQEDLDI